uniref:Uncharacterized protein n=1 Tax=Alexandrium monilatum TaxID=311494 RepID=A0A7S4VKW8_9DINO
MPAHPDSAGEILLRVVSMVERYHLDTGIDNMLRTAMAPEDASGILSDPALKLEQARNPSSLLVNHAKPHIKRAKAERCVTLVPMLKWIDRTCKAWQLDAEAEALLKFMAPCTQVLGWLEQLGNELPRAGSPCAFVKARLRALLAEAAAPGPRRGPRRRSRSAGSREPKRPRRGGRSEEPRGGAPAGQPRRPGSPARGRVPPPREGGGLRAAGGCKGDGKGSGQGNPMNDPAALMAQIQRLQQELNSAKRDVD